MAGAVAVSVAQVDELAALQEATPKELDALLPSVLDRAFRGGTRKRGMAEDAG